jgi:hypothetical protein
MCGSHLEGSSGLWFAVEVQRERVGSVVLTGEERPPVLLGGERLRRYVSSVSWWRY